MKAVLTITVEINEAENPSVSDKDLERTLRHAADHLADNGLLSPLDATLETWEAFVEFKSPEEEEV